METEVHKVEVTKSFAQEAELAEELERLTELNVFLNMNEKLAEHRKDRILADSPRGRISVKEKLAEMRKKAYDQKVPVKLDISRMKGKKESL